MTQIWLDECGKPRPTRACKHCGAEAPLYELMRPEHLRMGGWKKLVPASYVNWCGHQQDVVPVPTPDRCWLIPYEGKAQ